MNNSDKKPVNSWLILNLIINLSLLILYSAAVYMTGIDNLTVLINSSYAKYLILSFSVLVILISINLFPAFYIFKPGKLKITKLILNIQKYFSIIQVLIITATLLYAPTLYRNLKYGKMPTAPGKFRYTAGPFVQFGPYQDRQIVSTSESMTIWWYTPEKISRTGYVKYGKTESVKEMITAIETLGGDGYHHTVALNKLSQSTTYYYTIPGFKDDIFSFTTGPAEVENSSFSFLCTGDVRNSGKDSVAFYEIINRSADSFYADAGRNPAFKLVLGDLTYKGSDLESWNVYFNYELVHSKLYPTISVMGNHEFHTDYGGNFDYFMEQPRYFSFNFSNAHFIIIHNYDGIFRTTGKEQYEFVKKDLEENYNKKWIIVALHEPPLSTGDYNMNELLIGQYFKLFRKYRVDLVLTGHDHHYDTFWVDKKKEWGGTIYVVNGGGGSRIDDYIMRRKNKRWKTWIHDRNSSHGLYLNDEYTRKYHVYGEISWGFMDIEVNENSLKTSYYRWMDINSYLEKTEQVDKKWEMVPINFINAEAVHSLKKKREFK